MREEGMLKTTGIRNDVLLLYFTVKNYTCNINILGLVTVTRAHDCTKLHQQKAWS